jgi:Uncharacterised nucleotidyltransferase
LSHSRRRGSFWPTPTQRALMEVALGPVEEASARWEALQSLDLTTLETGSFGLLPLLYERLRDVVPNEPQLPRLFGTYRSVWYRNQLLLDRLAVLLPLLRERARVEPLLVGGMSALLRWYPRLGLRPVPQLDLIVPRETAAETVKVSTYAGWRPAAQTRSSTVLRDESRRVLVIHHGAPPAVAGPLEKTAMSALAEHALELGGTEGTPLALDAADELLFACAMGARTLPVQTCQWLVDVHRVLHSPEAPTADALLERARRVRLVAHVRATVGYLAEVAGDDVLHGYAVAFASEQIGQRERIAFALAGARGSRVAGTAQALALYLQTTADDPPLRAVARLPRHLQERWEVESLAGVPFVALQKTVGLLSAQARGSEPDLNRSASS